MGLKKETPEEDISFPELLTRRICTGHNQCAVIIIDGPMGTGKSLASLRLGYDTSLWFAKMLGDKHHPSYYFNIDHVGILTGDETIRIVKSIEQYKIFILDDAGAEGLNNRAWSSDQNKMMSKLLMTFRTQNNVLIMSSPSQDFLDVVARKLAHFKITMVKAYFKEKITLGKLSMIKRISTKNSNNIIYPFLRTKSQVFNYLQFDLPPEPLRVEYEKRRKRIEREMNTASLDEFEKGKQEALAKSEGKATKAAEGEATRKLHCQVYKSLVDSGVKAKDALRKATETTGLELSQQTVLRDYNKFYC
jgi:hypothetical protein